MAIDDSIMDMIRLVFFVVEDVLLIHIIVYFIKIDLLRKDHKKSENPRRK